MLSAADWHRRYLSQAAWTRHLRNYLYKKVNISQARTILDVGCGTGALESELSDFTKAQVIGIDIDDKALLFSQQYSANATYILADASHIPISNSSIDLCLCHFFLLWIQAPEKVFAEMIRVTRPGGSILVLAEPDYGGRIDYPSELEIIAEWQKESLRMQGADPFFGRKLASLFETDKVNLQEYGVLGGRWKTWFDYSSWELEWEVIEDDIKHLSEKGLSNVSIEDLKLKDLDAYRRGNRVLFVPTFYAWGIVN